MLAEITRKDGAWATVLGVVTLAVYAATACRTIYPGDSPELVTAMATWGVSHPPGYPLYTMLGGVLVRALGFLGTAYAANLTSSLYATGAVTLMFLLLRRWQVALPLAVFGASSLAFGRTFWSQAVYAEVYTLDLLLWMATLHVALNASRRTTRVGTVLSGLVVGLWIGHRILNVLYLPFVAVLWWAWRDRKTRIAWGWLGLGLVLAVLPFLYLPLASAQEPYLDRGNPETVDSFLEVVTARGYQRHLESTGDLTAGRIGLYFRSIPREVGVAALAAVLAFVVLRGGERKPWRTALALGGCVVVNLIFSSRYNVLDVHVYFLMSWVALSMLAGLGLNAWSRGQSRVVHGVLAVGVVFLACFNAPANTLRDHSLAERFGRDVLAQIDEPAVLFARGDYTEPPLWFLQAVEGVGTDVVLVDPLQLELEWYRAQLRQRHPEIDWPDSHLGSQWAWHLLETRPAYFLFNVSPDSVIQDPTRWEVQPAGLTLRLRPRGEPVGRLDDQEAMFVEWAARVREQVPAVEPDSDLPTLYLLGYFARGVFNAAEFLRAQGRGNAAPPLYQQVLAMDPAQIDRRLEAAYRTTGLAHQPSRLAERCRAVLGIAP